MGALGLQQGAVGSLSSCRWLLLVGCCVLMSSLPAAAAAAACQQGDTPCWCQQIGGQWKALQAPLLPACKVVYQHQGAERYVHIYLPRAYDGSTQWPVWVHLHGVFWATMGDIGARVGKPVNGTDIIPAFDHSVEILGDKAILVYPQSTGEAGNGTPDEGQGAKYRQFWRIPFWRCSVGICRDPSVDDIGFIEQVVADLPKRLPLKPGHYLLSGESAGGMMVHAILCSSRAITGLVDAAIDMLGGIGADYARGSACAPGSSTPIPFLKLHGVEDPFITYSRDILVDGVNFASSIEATQVRAKANGCGPQDSGPKDVAEADGKMLCTDFCNAAGTGKPAAKLCGMPGVGHDTDHPHPGFVYEQSWAWFQDQVKLAEAAAKQRRPTGGLTKLPERDAALAPHNASKPAANTTTAAAAAKQKKDAAAAAAVAAAARAAALKKSTTSPQPLTLSITYPGATLDDFKTHKAGAAIIAVANMTGLPASNITASYALAAEAAEGDDSSSSSSRASDGSRRRLLLQRRRLAAAAEVPAAGAGGGVTGSYTLTAGKPADVAQKIIAAVEDGSLLQSLQQKGLASAQGQGPLVTLSSGAAGAAAQQVLLESTDLVQVAAAPQAAAAVDCGSAGQHAAGSSSGGSSGSKTVVVVGAVLGGLAGAVLLAGAAFWAVKRHRQQREQVERLQQLQQQADAFSQEWDQKQQQGARVFSLNASSANNADAVMCIASEDSVRAGSKGW